MVVDQGRKLVFHNRNGEHAGSCFTARGLRRGDLGANLHKELSPARRNGGDGSEAQALIEYHQQALAFLEVAGGA
jgi:hypothetical protein